MKWVIIILTCAENVLVTLLFLPFVSFAIILGLFICYFIVMFTSKSKKASVKQILSGTYSKVYVNQPNKRFLSQSKKYSPRSSGGSSGGGHRSGGGGGGGRSGGGGGHKI